MKCKFFILPALFLFYSVLNGQIKIGFISYEEIIPASLYLTGHTLDQEPSNSNVVFVTSFGNHPGNDKIVAIAWMKINGEIIEMYSKPYNHVSDHAIPEGNILFSNSEGYSLNYHTGDDEMPLGEFIELEIVFKKIKKKQKLKWLVMGD